jgi:hypothetical protein
LEGLSRIAKLSAARLLHDSITVQFTRSSSNLLPCAETSATKLIASRAMTAKAMERAIVTVAGEQQGMFEAIEDVAWRLGVLLTLSWLHTRLYERRDA